MLDHISLADPDVSPGFLPGPSKGLLSEPWRNRGLEGFRLVGSGDQCTFDTDTPSRTPVRLSEPVRARTKVLRAQHRVTELTSLLLGKNTPSLIESLQVSEPSVNDFSMRYACQPSVEDWLAIAEEACENGLDVCGFWHSHRESRVPSPRDLNFASMWRRELGLGQLALVLALPDDTFEAFVVSATCGRDVCRRAAL